MALFTNPVTGQINDQIATDLNLAFPEIRRKAQASRGDQWAPAYELMTAMGYSVGVSQETYTHYEDEFWIPSVGIKTNTGAGAPGAAVTIIIQEDANGRTYLREGDEIILKGDIECIVKEKLAVDQFSVVPKLAAEAVPALTGGTDEVSITSDSFGEGTDQPEGRMNSWFEDGGELQIYKETIDVTGTAKTSETWISGSTESGAGSGRTLWHLNQPMAEYRIKMQMSNSFMTNRRADNPLAQVDKNGNAVGSTEGAIPYIQRRGNVTSIAAGATTLADFNALELYAASQRAEGIQLVLSGLTRGQEYNDLFKTEFADSNIPQVQKVMDNDYVVYKEMSLGAIIDYKLLKTEANAYCFSQYSVWNHPNIYNTATLGSIYQNYSVFLPFGMYKDPKLGDYFPYWGYAYKTYGGYNRKMEVWDFGTAKPVNRIGGVDSDNLYVRAHQGTWFACGNRMQLIELP